MKRRWHASLQGTSIWGWERLLNQWSTFYVLMKDTRSGWVPIRNHLLRISISCFWSISISLLISIVVLFCPYQRELWGSAIASSNFLRLYTMTLMLTTVQPFRWNRHQQMSLEFVELLIILELWYRFCSVYKNALSSIYHHTISWSPLLCCIISILVSSLSDFCLR